jgi:hypothetical protein
MSLQADILCAAMLQELPLPWLRELRHLDLSGQGFTRVTALADILLCCSSLASLSIAGCSDCAWTFLMWPLRDSSPAPSRVKQLSTAAAAAAGGKAPTAEPAQTGTTAAGSAAGGDAAAGPLAAGGVAPSVSINSSSSSSNTSSQSTAAPACGSPRAELPGGIAACSLRVLDVSGCAELAAPTSQLTSGRLKHVCGLLQGAVGAMPRLQGKQA